MEFLPWSVSVVDEYVGNLAAANDLGAGWQRYEWISSFDFSQLNGWLQIFYVDMGTVRL